MLYSPVYNSKSGQCCGLVVLDHDDSETPHPPPPPPCGRWQMGHAVRRWRREPLPQPAAQPGAPVLGFRQPVAALTHVATGPASQSRNSINKPRPLDSVHRVRAETPRERVHHLLHPPPPPPPAPCHMSASAANVQYIGLSFIRF